MMQSVSLLTPRLSHSLRQSLVCRLERPHHSVHSSLPCNGCSISSISTRAAASSERASSRAQAEEQPEISPESTSVSASDVFLSSFGLYVLSSGAAVADTLDAAATSPFSGVQANSLWVTLGLFLLCVPGIWSQIKRAPQSKKVRKTFEIDGPSKPGAVPLDDRARQIFQYFKHYNYEVKETGEVITFKGTYGANKGQAAAVTFYTFMGLGSIALVLSTAFQSDWFYLLTLLSPGAWVYYMQKGTREEEIRVKMLTADDDMTTDILVEGDVEEIERLRKELALLEKGKVYVKGILEKV